MLLLLPTALNFRSQPTLIAALLVCHLLKGELLKRRNKTSAIRAASATDALFRHYLPMAKRYSAFPAKPASVRVLFFCCISINAHSTTQAQDYRSFLVFVLVINRWLRNKTV